MADDRYSFQDSHAHSARFSMFRKWDSSDFLLPQPWSRVPSRGPIIRRGSLRGAKHDARSLSSIGFFFLLARLWIRILEADLDVLIVCGPFYPRGRIMLRRKKQVCLPQFCAAGTTDVRVRVKYARFCSPSFFTAGSIT